MPTGAQVDVVRRNPWRPAVWGAAATLLALPAVAMRFTDEVRWTALDFAVFGAMLLLACVAYEVAARASGDRSYRLAAAIAILAAFLMTWVDLAVGIVGDAGNPANAWFFGVLGIGLVGAAAARFRAPGMARAAFAAAIAQAALTVAMLFTGVLEAVVLSALLSLAWLASGLLFGRAARSSS